MSETIPDTNLIQTAISVVDQERTSLSTECQAFDDFREAIRLVTPDPTSKTGQSETATEIAEAYRETVMATNDYEAIHGNTLSKSLENEFSPAIADSLLSKDPITQRHKRKLLVATTESIRTREQFQSKLLDERDALESFESSLTVVHSEIEKLPTGPLQQMEDLLIVWDEYNRIKHICEKILEKRQYQIQNPSNNIQISGNRHILNEYLYSDINTVYPVLSTLGKTIEWLKTKQTDINISASPKLSLES